MNCKAFLLSAATAVFFFATTANAVDPLKLLGEARERLLPDFSYSVHVSSVVATGKISASKARAAQAATPPRNMRKALGRPLRLAPAPTQRAAGRTAAGDVTFSFTVDVASFLGDDSWKQLQWEVNGPGEIAGEQCLWLVGAAEGLRSELCVRDRDAAVVGFELYLSGRHIGSTTIEYGPPVQGILFPSRTTTYFPLNNQTIVNIYSAYKVS